LGCTLGVGSPLFPNPMPRVSPNILGQRCRLAGYSFRFKTKVTFGHNLRYKTKGTFGKISLKLRQTNWNVARNNVDVVANELPSQLTNNLHLFNN
jgi:hypothetical protein